MSVRTCTCVSAMAPVKVRGQLVGVGSLSIMWILGIKLRFGGHCLYLLSHVTSPSNLLLTRDTKVTRMKWHLWSMERQSLAWGQCLLVPELVLLQFHLAPSFEAILNWHFVIHTLLILIDCVCFSGRGNFREYLNYELIRTALSLYRQTKIWVISSDTKGICTVVLEQIWFVLRCIISPLSTATLLVKAWTTTIGLKYL